MAAKFPASPCQFVTGHILDFWAWVAMYDFFHQSRPLVRVQAFITYKFTQMLIRHMAAPGQTPQGFFIPRLDFLQLLLIHGYNLLPPTGAERRGLEL